jgi:hypothetical protein
MTEPGVAFGKASWRAFCRINVGLPPGSEDDINEIVRSPSNLETVIRSLEVRYTQV